MVAQKKDRSYLTSFRELIRGLWLSKANFIIRVKFDFELGSQGWFELLKVDFMHALNFSICMGPTSSLLLNIYSTKKSYSCITALFINHEKIQKTQKKKIDTKNVRPCSPPYVIPPISLLVSSKFTLLFGVFQKTVHNIYI